jgi:hypothetical protein
MRFQRFLIFFLAVLMTVSCSTARRNNAAGKAYGGGFETIAASQEESNAQRPEAEKILAIGHTPTPKYFKAAPKADARAILSSPIKHLSKVALFKNHLQPPDSTVRDSTAKIPVEKHARLGFIFSLAGLVTAFIPVAGILAIPLMIAGLILGIIGKKNIRENPGKYRGKGMAITAIVIPIVLLLLIVLILLVYIAILLALLGV